MALPLIPQGRILRLALPLLAKVPFVLSVVGQCCVAVFPHPEAFIPTGGQTSS